MVRQTETPIPPAELAVVRDLSRRVREIAEDPLNQERRQLWRLHNAKRPRRPMVLAEMGGVMAEFEPLLPSQCSHPATRPLERDLRTRIYNFETLRDDRVISGHLDCGWQVQISDRGVTTELQRGDNAHRLGSYTWDPPLKDLAADLGKLRPRTFTVDREATRARSARLAELVDGILPVRIRGGFWWTTGLTGAAIQLVGLEQFMLYMIDDPAALHALLAFLRDDQIQLAEGLEAAGLLTLNNDYDYIGSGSVGCSDELPQPGTPADRAVQLRDLWGLSESQETVGISPAMFGEFVFPYQQPIIERFGLSYYGCCEPVHDRWPFLKRLNNLRKVSISPWCDQRGMAEAMGADYVYCRKPNPTMVSCQTWDEDLLLNDLRETMTVAGHCNVEFAMKDVHTLAEQPWRLSRWVELARQVIDESV